MFDTMTTTTTSTFPATRADAPIFSPLEKEAIRIGLREGDATLTRSRSFGFLWLFLGAKPKPLANTCLEKLRAYAELAYVLLARGRTASTATLEDVGFSAGQIAALNRLVVVHTSNLARPL
jgi:hypothetical protein